MAQRKLNWWARTGKALRSETARTWSHRSPALMVAAVALYVSYWHIREIAAAHTHDLIAPMILPLSVDGLLIVSARYVTRAKTPLGKVFSMVGFVLGMLATLAGNLLTSDGTAIGYGVATWPAVAVIVTGVILHWGDAKPKAKAATPRTRAAKAPSTATAAATPITPKPTTPNGHKPVGDISAVFAPQSA